MAAPILGIPALYELLVGTGLLAGGAITAQQMQKQVESNPELVQEALKRVFTGPATNLVNPDVLKSVSQTPSGSVFGPQQKDIDKIQKEIKELSKLPGYSTIDELMSNVETLNPPEQETKQLTTPIPGSDIIEINKESFPPAPKIDTSILTMKDPKEFLAKDKNTKQYIEATNPTKIFGETNLQDVDYKAKEAIPIEYRFDPKTYNAVYEQSIAELNDKTNVDIPKIAKKFNLTMPDINLVNSSLEAAADPDKRYWYQRSGNYLKNLVTTIDPNATDKDVATFIDIVSVTSGGVAPKQNLKLALGVYSDLKQNQPSMTGFKTQQSLDKYLSNKDEVINTPKFGNFTDTMKYFAKVGERQPNVVNDLQMAKLFGVKPDQLASNPELYNAMTGIMNNLTAEVNKQLPKGQELQPFELQSLMWSQARGVASNYEQVGQELIKELYDQGINIETDVMKPDFAARLQKTITPYKEAMKGTIEIGSFLTPQGKEIEKIINQFGTDPKVMDGINSIHVSGLKKLITKQAKQPSVIEDVVSNVIGQKAEISRMQVGLGTYEGKANYNVVIPLTVNTAQGPRPLTDEERLQTLAVLGTELNQAAMAASNFRTLQDINLKEGEQATGQIYAKFPVDQSKIQQLHAETGLDFNVSPVPGGFIGSIISFKGEPDKAKLDQAFEKVFGKNAEMVYTKSAWKGDYIESKDYKGYYDGVKRSISTRVGSDGATKFDLNSFDSATEKARNISKERDAAYQEFINSPYITKLRQVKSNN
jgi:uncharacterized protein YneF (UPF0154 family)